MSLMLRTYGLLLLLAINLICLGCNTTAPSISNTTDHTLQLVGTWFGRQQADDAKHGTVMNQWFIEYFADGSFGSHYKTLAGNEVIKDHQEFGTWMIENNHYNVTTSLLVNEKGSFAPSTPEGEYIERYKILQFTPTVFEYQNTKNGYIYKVERVPKDFRF